MESRAKHLEDLKQDYLSLSQEELRTSGIDESKVILNAQGLVEVEEHLVDMAVFMDTNPTWSRPDMLLRAYTLDHGFLIFMPNREFMDEFREDDNLYNELDEISKKVDGNLKSITDSYLASVSELNSDKTLQERICEGLRTNLQVTESLSDIASWKAKVLVGNSIGKDGPKVGEWDEVGYTHIGIQTGTIVPVARGDEHHQGYDLIHDLVAQGLIPQDKYFPIFHGGDYVRGQDSLALEAYKTWRKLGGPNVVIKNSSSGQGDPFQVTIDDYIKAEGNIHIEKGTLYPLGQGFIDRLRQLSEACVQYRASQRGEKQVYVQSIRLVTYYQEKLEQHATTSSNEIKAKVLEAEKLGGLEGLQKLEEAIFGFDGLKNQLHQKVRKALDPKAFSFTRDEMVAIFGDLDLANHELGSL